MRANRAALDILAEARINEARAHEIVESRVQVLMAEALEALDACERVAAAQDGAAKDRLLRWAEQYDRYRDRMRRLGRWIADEAERLVKTRSR